MNDYIPGLSQMSPKTKACTMKKIVLSGKVGNGYLAFGSREWDALLEMGDGRDVIIEFLRLYHADPDLQVATKLADHHWIDSLLKNPAYKTLEQNELPF